MSPALLYALVGAVAAGLALNALFVRPGLLHKVVAANVAATGSFLVLLHGDGGLPPDPVPQALVLTGIVISVAITAYAAALVRRLFAATGAARLPDDDPPT